MSNDLDITGFREHIERFESALRPKWKEIGSTVAKIVREIVIATMVKGKAGTFNETDHLRSISGSLAKSFTAGETGNILIVNISTNEVRIESGSSLPQLAINEVGATINVTDKMRAFFWAKFIETHLQFWKIIAISAIHKAVIHLKARPLIPSITKAFESREIDRVSDEVLGMIARTWEAA